LSQEGATALHDLRRLLRPRSIAIVGLSEKFRLANIDGLVALRDVELFLVHPSKPSLFGLPTYKSITAIGKPVDAVFSLVNAERTPAVVSEARQCGAGGVVIGAAGFREVGDIGIALEQQLAEAAGHTFPCLGPNCFGFIDYANKVDLSLAGNMPDDAKPGSISVVTHTGGMIPALIAAGHERGIGFSFLISTGNETVIDMVDSLAFLVDDPRTHAICLIVEAIRRPAEFLEIAGRAIKAGKPIVALKLGRSARSVAIARSHTGSIAGDAWVYEAAFRQHGIVLARGLSEMLDMVVGFDLLPPDRWDTTDGLAVVTPTGGGASMASDIFADFGLNLPPLDSIRDQVSELLPKTEVINPLDTTGFLFSNPQMASTIAELYSGAPEAGTVLFQWHLQDKLFDLASPFITRLFEGCKSKGKSFVLSAADDAYIGKKAKALLEKGAMVIRGPVAAARALRTMGQFTENQRRVELHDPISPPATVRPPAAESWVSSDAGPMLTFAATMDLLRSVGVEVAPFKVIQEDEDVGELPRGETFVVKLADVPHRTDIKAVRLNVTARDIASAVDEMRQLAYVRRLPTAVVVQPHLRIDGEAFMGIKADSGFGPMVVCGIGGIFVEILRRVCGLIAPFRLSEATYALRELDDTHVFEGLRGGPAWDRVALARIMVALGQLAAGAREWLSALDINPLAFVDGRFVAIDCLCIRRESPAAQ
jgi:acyl-CoA synthetase (NDP forming)